MSRCYVEAGVSRGYVEAGVSRGYVEAGVSRGYVEAGEDIIDMMYEREGVGRDDEEDYLKKKGVMTQK